MAPRMTWGAIAMHRIRRVSKDIPHTLPHLKGRSNCMTWAVEVAARTLCQEARGEPPEGQRAVAHVLKNRLKSGHWGQSLATVCLWPYQFSGWRGPKDPNFEYACNLRDDDPLLLKMWKLMLDVLDSADDPTGGATHYVNLAIVIKKPEWIDGAPEHGIPAATHCGRFGAQDFFKDVQ